MGRGGAGPAGGAGPGGTPSGGCCDGQTLQPRPRRPRGAVRAVPVILLPIPLVSERLPHPQQSPQRPAGVPHRSRSGLRARLREGGDRSMLLNLLFKKLIFPGKQRQIRVRGGGAFGDVHAPSALATVLGPFQKETTGQSARLHLWAQPWKSRWDHASRLDRDSPSLQPCPACPDFFRKNGHLSKQTNGHFCKT